MFRPDDGVLDLGGQHLGDAVVDAVAASWPFFKRRLKRLHLGGNDITDEGRFFRVDGLVGNKKNFLGIPWDLWQGFWEHLPGLLALHVLLYIFCSNDCYCILCLNYIVLSCLLHMHEYYTILFRHVHGYVAIYSMFMFVYVCLL